VNSLINHPLWVAYRLNLRALRVYTQDFLLRLIAFPFQILLAVILWKTVAATGQAPGIDLRYMVAYYAVVLALGRMIPFGQVSLRLARDIYSGNLSIALARPVSVWWMPLAELLATATAALIMALPIMAAIMLWQGIPPARLVQGFCLFLVGAYLQFWFYFWVGTLAFWTEEIRGVLQGVNLALGLATGALVPLSLFPPAAQSALQLTPFYYFVFLPTQTLLQPEGLPNWAMLAMLTWAALLPLLALTTYRWGLRRFTAHGV